MHPFKRGIMGFEDYNYAQFNKDIFVEEESSIGPDYTQVEAVVDDQLGVSDSSLDEVQVVFAEENELKKKEFSLKQI